MQTFIYWFVRNGLIFIGRSKQYDLQKMLDLYNNGNSYEEIAEKF